VALGWLGGRWGHDREGGKNSMEWENEVVSVTMDNWVALPGKLIRHSLACFQTCFESDPPTPAPSCTRQNPVLHQISNVRIMYTLPILAILYAIHDAKSLCGTSTSHVGPVNLLIPTFPGNGQCLGPIGLLTIQSGVLCNAYVEKALDNLNRGTS
jgi:hypothetical protein